MKRGPGKVIVFDMDNTLVDEFGAGVRPGIVGLLEGLRKDGHRLVLWTNSRRQRALGILRDHDLRRHFAQCICREDYDPDEKDVPKDIRKVGGDFLIDDDPAAVAYVKSIGKDGFRIAAFRKGMTPEAGEIARIRAAIGARRGFFRRTPT